MVSLIHMQVECFWRVLGKLNTGNHKKLPLDRLAGEWRERGRERASSDAKYVQRNGKKRVKSHFIELAHSRILLTSASRIIHTLDKSTSHWHHFFPLPLLLLLFFSVYCSCLTTGNRINLSMAQARVSSTHRQDIWLASCLFVSQWNCFIGLTAHAVSNERKKRKRNIKYTQVASERGYAYTIHSNVFVSYLPIFFTPLHVCFFTLSPLLPVCGVQFIPLSPCSGTQTQQSELLHSRKKRNTCV